MRMKIRLLVLFLEYEQERYKGAFEQLQSFVDGISLCDTTYVVIDNRDEDASWRQVGKVYHVGGDNSFREFSGWQKGLDLAREKGLQYDLLLVCNNSFLVNGKSYLQDISLFHLLKVIVTNGALGRVDSSQESMEVLHHTFADWICSNCFFLSRKAVEKLDGRLISLNEKRMAQFLSKEFRPFKKLLKTTCVNREELNGCRFTVRALLPLRQKIECQVQIDKVFVPSKHGMGDDNRELGVLIREVRLEGKVLDLKVLSKGGYGVEDNTLWMGKTVNLFLETEETGALEIDCYIQQDVFAKIYGGELTFSFFAVKGIFQEDAPISRNYQIYILDWLTHNWHSKYEISAENWSQTREKVSCILNEVLLTARIREAGVKILGANILN